MSVSPPPLVRTEPAESPAPPPRRLAMINSDGKTRPLLSDPPGVHTTLYDLRLRVMARTPYDHLFTELGTVDAAETALAAGCDVLSIDTFGDYGLARIRSITGIPVIGAGETSVAVASAELGSYSIVTVWPRSMAYLYDERLTSCPGGAGCAGVHYVSDETELDRVGSATGVKARMIRHEGELVDRLVESCMAAVSRDGSAGVLLGCTCMSPVALEIQSRCDFPVLDPSRLTQEAAFAAALAVTTPRTGDPAGQPAGRATEIVEAYLAQQGVDAMAPDDCDVCAVVRTP